MNDDPIGALVREIEELRRRMENMIRPSRIKEVDHQNGLVKIEIDPMSDPPVDSQWLPWVELSGGKKTRNMPDVGQQVVGLFPSGSVEQGWVYPGHFTNDNPAPAAPNGESVYARGSVTQTITDEYFEIKRGGDLFKMEPGKITLSLGGQGFEITSDFFQMTHKFRAKDPKNKAAHYVTGFDSGGDRALDGQDNVIL